MSRSLLRRMAWLAMTPIACAAFAAAPSSSVTPSQLAALAFPGWSDSAAGRIQTLTLPHLPGMSRSAGHGGWYAGSNRVLVDPRLVLRLDATHLVLIAGLVPSEEGSQPTVAHTTPMALAAYQFEQRQGAWQVSGRQGVFALRGFFGEAQLRAVELADRRQALAVEYGSCWQGYCGTWMSLYEVDKGTVRADPAVELALSGINVDGAGDCLRRLQPLVKPRAQQQAAYDAAAADNHDCYAIESSWTVEPSRGQPGDLVIRYQGAISRADTHTLPPSAIDQRQVLRYGSGKYRAVSGFNPVPPI